MPTGSRRIDHSGMRTATTGRADAIGTRALNRALLARQMLLRRERLPVVEAVERLVGLQAQAPTPPYFGLWTRLEEFQPDELSRAIAARELVRIAVMRSTIHLLSARDCLRLRPAMQPVVQRGFQGSYGRRLAGLDLRAVAAAGRSLLDDRPRTFAELGALLRERWPDRDPVALAYAVRAFVPLVQLPPRGLWRQSGPAVHGAADAWLGRGLDPAPPLEEVVLRYLAAFGPATANDVRAWSGLTRLGPVVERLRPRLRAGRDERGRELLDVPDASRPDPDTPAPPRFLPEFDNALLSHVDRSRIVADRDRPRVYRNGMVASTVLVDGFVRGTWRIERGRRAATLHVALFERQPKAARLALAEEGARLLDFAAGDAGARDVRIAGAS